MKTSQQWWDECKADPAKFDRWLQKQYEGEVTASKRIERLRDNYENSPRAQTILSVIADQENMHAAWVKQLMVNRGLIVVEADQEEAENRYWAETLPGIEDFVTGCAVAAHAEAMRLDRIRVISEDETAPPDVRHVFTQILREELFHERAFRELSTPEAMEATRGNHELGLVALGLTS